MTWSLRLVTAAESFTGYLGMRLTGACVAHCVILEVIRGEVRAACGRLGKIRPLMLFIPFNPCIIFRYGCIHPC